MTSLFRSSHASILAAVVAVSASACGTEVTFVGGSGAAQSGGNNTGANNTGANNTGAANTGGNNTGAANTGGNNGVDCINANNFDPCSSPGSYCSYYDASTKEYCDAYCDDSLRWQKNCYVEPTYCYDPPECPSSPPANGTYCPTADNCDYYDCEFYGACGGTGYASASCQDNVWYTYEECYCYEPANLCPSTPPLNGAACTTTAQCQQYDCNWENSCGANTYHYAYCDGSVFYSDGDCN